MSGGSAMRLELNTAPLEIQEIVLSMPATEKERNYIQSVT
jgi:hypothetical protein